LCNVAQRCTTPKSPKVAKLGPNFYKFTFFFLTSIGKSASD
jgi:hypothetical protein